MAGIRRVISGTVALLTVLACGLAMESVTAGAAQEAVSISSGRHPASAAGIPSLLALQGATTSQYARSGEGGVQRFDPVRLPNGPRSTVSFPCPAGGPDSMVAAVPVGTNLVGVDGYCGRIVVVAGGGTGSITFHSAAPSFGIARSPDGSLAYTLSASGISAINTSTWQVVRTVPVAGTDVTAPSSAQVGVDPATGDVWVDTPKAAAAVHVLAPTTLAPLAAIAATGGVLGGSIAFTPGSAWLPVNDQSGGALDGTSKLVRVATATYSANWTQSFTGLAGDAVGAPSGTHVYIVHGTATGGAGETQVSDVATGSLIVQSVDVTVGSLPTPDSANLQVHLAVSQDGSSIYFSGSVWGTYPGYEFSADQIDNISTATDTVVSEWSPAAGSYDHLITGLVAATLTGPPYTAPTVGLTATSDGNGYWVAATDGSIVNFGDAGFAGSAGSLILNRPIVGMAATPNGKGYWEVAADGGIFASGDASYDGSTAGTALSAPIVGMAATPDGRGYWLVAADGGVFTFGDARFYGSAATTALSAPVVGMTTTPDGKGYWLVAADGGVFTFGDAGFHGSAGGESLNRPIVGMAPTHDGRGYWLVAADGGVFTFGDARFYGSEGGMTLDQPVVGMAATPGGTGYWLVAADGGIFTFGDAGYFGSNA